MGYRVVQVVLPGQLQREVVYEAYGLHQLYQLDVCHVLPASVSKKKEAYERIISFLARATYLGLLESCAISTPMARLETELVSNKILVTSEYVATVIFGLLRTSGVRYAVSVDDRLPLESI